MGDSLRTGKPSRYVTSYAGQLSLAVLPWEGAMAMVTATAKGRKRRVPCSSRPCDQDCWWLTSWLKALAVKLSHRSGRSRSYTSLIRVNLCRFKVPKVDELWRSLSFLWEIFCLSLVSVIGRYLNPIHATGSGSVASDFLVFSGKYLNRVIGQWVALTTQLRHTV